LYGAENWTLRKVVQKYLGSFKCSAGEGWRSVAMIMWRMKYFIELRRTGISYVQQIIRGGGGRKLSGLHAFCVGTAF
jgi:hypothetical protein